MPLEGFAELTGQGTVAGWAWDSDAPEAPVELEVVDGATHYERVVADRFDAPLGTAGRRGGQCGFVAPVPAGSQCRVIVSGTAHCLPMSRAEDPVPLWNWLDGEGARFRPAVLVHRLCKDILGHPATETQLTRFTGRTENRYALARLVRDVLDDAPDAGLLTVRDVVRQAYVGVLGRMADPSGLDHFGAEILRGMPVSDMIASLMESPEFAARSSQQIHPAALDELKQVARTVQAAVTTLTLHTIAPPPARATLPRPGTMADT